MKIRVGVGIASAFCWFGLAFSNGGSGLPAWGETTNAWVRRVWVPEATGQTGAPPPLIQLSPGYGVNISFIPTGETVQKVWFDNPSFATLDADGCLSGLGGQQRECLGNQVRVLHLRRITPLDIPGLPKTNSTLLTVITSGKAGRQVYLFQVAVGSERSSQYHTIEVTPRQLTARNARQYRPVVESITDWQTFNWGLTVAQERRLVRPGQPLWNRIQNFLVKVKVGEQIEAAAQSSGISLTLVKRLQELGTETSAAWEDAGVDDAGTRGRPDAGR